MQAQLLIALVIETALATYVATRAWSYRPARLFLWPVAAFAVLNIGSVLRLEAPSAAVAYRGVIAEVLGLAALDTTLLLLFSSLFMPRWWEGRRPIGIILLPYVATTLLLLWDALGRHGWFVAGVALVDGHYLPVIPRPSGTLMIGVMASSWLPHVTVLLLTFWRQPARRAVITLLLVPILVAWGLARLPGDTVRAFGPLYTIFQTVPMLVALAYAVVRGRVFEPTTAALNLALHSMQEAVAVLDRRTHITYTNPPASALGLTVGQTLGAALAQTGAESRAARALVAQAHTGSVEPTPQTLLLGTPPRLFAFSVCEVRDPSGAQHGALLLGRDITEIEHRTRLLEQERAQLAEAVAQLHYLANHDPLTGLLNRRSLSEHLERVVVRAQRGHPAALLFIDLDHFKVVNDTFGHAAGDQVLVILSGVLASEVRGGDVLARLGGDEFAVILEQTAPPQASEIAERMRRAVAEYPWQFNGQPFVLSLSMGVVAITGDRDAPTVLAQADHAMYSAKVAGRNQVGR